MWITANRIGAPDARRVAGQRTGLARSGPSDAPPASPRDATERRSCVIFPVAQILDQRSGGAPRLIRETASCNGLSDIRGSVIPRTRTGGGAAAPPGASRCSSLPQSRSSWRASGRRRRVAPRPDSPRRRSTSSSTTPSPAPWAGQRASPRRCRSTTCASGSTRPSRRGASGHRVDRVRRSARPHARAHHRHGCRHEDIAGLSAGPPAGRSADSTARRREPP